MGNRFKFQTLCQVGNRRLLSVIGILAVLAVLSQLLVFPYGKYISILSRAGVNVTYLTVSGTTLSSKAKLTNAHVVHGEANDSSDSISTKGTFYESEEKGKPGGYNFSSDDSGQRDTYFEKEREAPSEFTSEKGLASDRSSKLRSFNIVENLTKEKGPETGLELTEKDKKSVAEATEAISLNTSANSVKGVSTVAGFVASRSLARDLEFAAEASGTALPYVATINMSLIPDGKKDLEIKPRDKVYGLVQIVSVPSKDSSVKAGKSVLKRTGRRPTSISEMRTLLRQGSHSNSMRPRWSSARDKELQNARVHIESAPILRNAPEVLASLFRNYSMFVRSYKLMEDVLRVYMYKEGEKPIFHQPYMRGIYASEGWFMKLMDGNRQFVVRDPRRAHLFYLPFSSLKLRSAVHQQHFAGQKDLESYLKNYVDLIAKQYRFWNRTKGADHFLVACHDWAPRFTRLYMGSCIRALCNSNIARGFEIGKDVSLPVTNIRSAKNPMKDLGGNHPSERPILAFFAGAMHGYLRPILLQYWNNKEPDMKIFGPMPRDIEGKNRYREFMKSSKYCICARGYEVHTPRIVESIYYECVPVIISDNYVPPFFEVLEWESFSIFISEKDIPNLRDILLSIPEEKFIVMQNRLKMVQQYFVWHKTPVKYDLFHMILHSIWYNRVFQVKS